MRIALAQINPTVGDVSGNSRKIVNYAGKAAADGADLVIFPELCVSGYPPLDLLHSETFIETTGVAVDWIASNLPAGTGAIIGAPIRNPSPSGKRLLNAGLLLDGGRVVDRACKMLLPTYDVFDEYRYFEPAAEQHPIDFRGLRIGLHVCEDMWNNEEYAEYHTYARDPIEELVAAGVDILINISASPFSVGKHGLRNDIVPEICRATNKPFVLVNQVGANTDVIFDGDSRVHSSDGTLLVCAPSFEEAVVIWDTSDTAPRPVKSHDPVEDLHDALVLGIGDYFRKTGAFDKALVGLSGGIDSAVTCTLAVEALGPDTVMGITLPSHISSPGSKDDSKKLAENLGIVFHEVSIEPAVEAFESMLRPIFEGTGSGVAEENIQARARGLALMGISNKFDHLLLTTGNKSELSMGYATLYGDMSGGLAVLSDVFKTQVYELADFINERAGYDLIPSNTITKPPSAELSPDQKDEDSLPPYDVLDEILRRYIEYREDVDRIAVNSGYDETLVSDILRAVDRNEYKRRQAAPGLRVSGKAFGLGRRQPIVMRYDRDDVAALFEYAPGTDNP
jgi:NAD+ synthase (glutamine-hydrolysing)